MLHIKKNQSIVQWYNALTTKGDVNKLAQFTDGSHFYEIVASLKAFSLHESKEGNLAAESVISSETIIACNEEVNKEEAAEGKMETSVSESGNDDPFVIKESDHTDTHKKYDIIRKFIDEFYHVESSSVIDYEECQNGKELELAKVAIFLLSAMVQNLLSTKNKLLYTTTLLEQEVQENIHECLSLFLGGEDNMDENQIKKSELHRILSRPASYKGTPIRKQPSRSISYSSDPSEGVKNVPKKRRERSVYEDVPDSPLKTLLESPKVQYKAAIYRKESELAKLRGALHNEESKVMDLTSEKNNLNKELEKIQKDLEFYKKSYHSVRAECLGKDDEIAEILKDKVQGEKKFKKKIETLEEDRKLLEEDNKVLQANFEALRDTQEQTNKLKLEIESLKLDNKKKSDTIKTLNEQVTNLEEGCKNNHQTFQDISPLNSRSGRRIVERKEHEPRRGPETKDERRKRLAAEEEKNGSTSGVTSGASLVKFESDRSAAASNEIHFLSNSASVSEMSDSHARICDNKMEHQLNANISDDSAHSGNDLDLNKGQLDYQRTILKIIILQLVGKNCISVASCRRLIESCKDISNGHTFSAFLRDLSEAVSTPAQPTVNTRRSYPSFFGNEVEELKENNRKLERDNQVLWEEVGNFSNFTNYDEIKIAYKRLEVRPKEQRVLKCVTCVPNKEYNAGLKKEIENLKQDVANLEQENAIFQEKYINMEKLVKKKENDVKKSLVMYKKVTKYCKDNMSKQCEECEKLRREVKELNHSCFNFEKDADMLKSTIKHLEGQVENLRYNVKELTKEKNELKHKLKIETSALSDNITDRDAVVHHYLSKSKHKAPETAKELQFRTNEEQRNSSVMKFNRHIWDAENEQSMPNSVFASSSIRSGFFQAADEDDFLNESSLAEIHSGSISEENRLQEIRRRNTLCPPHLQSCYPLEIQNMTPSEKKYFDIEEVSFDMGKSSSNKNFYKKPKCEYMGNDSDDSDDSNSFPVKKRKLAKADCMPAPVTKKQCRPSAKIIGPKEKPSTPLKRVAAFVRRQSHFKTPVSVQRLMSMPRKSKAL